MSYLVDTNAWIGFFEGKSDFGKSAKQTMIAQSADCFVSVASIWEAAIKAGLGKLKLPYSLESDLPRILDENGFTVVGIDVADAVAVRDLEPIHGDPFDRIQVVQARRRGWRMISRDPVFERYGMKRIW